VIPYFTRFVQRFPDLAALASASVEAVTESWSGLGYYSRARNLHKAAQAIVAGGGFPHTFQELAKFPGFGPYTSRSVASLAFDQSVGVVDGNVIRVLARIEAADWAWWQPKVRAQIQIRADAWVDQVSSYNLNQALMELGRTLCTPRSPSCLLCPVRGHCRSFALNEVNLRPQSKPRRVREIWVWQPEVTIRKQHILVRKNLCIPFLRGQWLLPGEARQVKCKPKQYDYQHSITHHDIFVTLQPAVSKILSDDKWIRLEEIRQYVPASLVQKALARVSHDTGYRGVHESAVKAHSHSRK
jgi:A/G-specific adenine glycosylase